MPVHKFGPSSGEPETYRLAPEKLIEGNPLQSVWMQYTDPTKKFFAGVWHSEVGQWKIAYTEEEYCEILEVTSVITDASSGLSTTVTTGERFVIPRGFVGTWEVVTATRKTFVVYEAG